ncbi:MAG: FAD-binding oxidoreductase [Bacilli bacterium]|nr:FAD-binding oxidoreductase [Bacilli bacterium]
MLGRGDWEAAQSGSELAYCPWEVRNTNSLGVKDVEHENIHSSLSSLIGTTHVQTQHNQLLVYPATEEEISQILRAASAHGYGVVPQGNGSQSQFGKGFIEKKIQLSLKRMTGIVEHSIPDLTAAVLAGTPLQMMQQVLKQSGQWLPIDPMVSAEATIGGIVAANSSGPKRILYGSLRDYVIGMRIVYPDGSVVKSGGKVVKNVAGYDLCKLFIGSRGTLGILTEITFKLRPLPHYQELVLIPLQTLDEAAKLQRIILASEFIPSSLELLTPQFSVELGQRPSYTLLVGCDEGEAACIYHRERLTELAGADFNLKRGEGADQFWQEYRSYFNSSSQDFLLAKVSVLPMQVLPFLQLLRELFDGSSVLMSCSAGLGTGIIRLTIQDGLNQDGVAPKLKIAREWAEKHQGALILEKAPFVIQKQLSIWGSEPSAFPLMKAIKQKIDPDYLLNSGSFIGGL